MPMRMIDLRCPRCGATKLDHFQRNSAEALPLCDVHTPVASEVAEVAGVVQTAPCLTPMERVYLPSTHGGVKDDSIPGGLWIKHGLCNPDGSPRRFDSYSEIARVAKEKGKYNHVEHMPSPGSDKNRWGHTSKWV